MIRRIKIKKTASSIPINKTANFYNFFPNNPQGKILYKDELLIEQIYDITTARAVSDPELSQSLLNTLSSEEHNLLAKVNIRQNGYANYDYLSLLLSSLVTYKNSVSGLCTQITEDKDKILNDDFIYPGMPVRICGLVQGNADVLKSQIRLCLDEFSVTIILNREHSLSKNVGFLKDKFLFVLGVITDVESEILIKAGALIL